ncbi:MAG: tRNA (guanosine(46)-N7)-methyltransferase TrmB [Flavobacteriaceae bacterium]
MGSKNKLKRFLENESFKHVIQPERQDLIENNFRYKGKWKSAFFKNKGSIILELGCGKAEYTINLAKLYPKNNFLGIDIKGARLWRGAKTAMEQNLKNVAFVRSQIELLDLIFDKNEVDQIWLTFPDPQIKYKRKKHRLVNTKFLNLYKKILVKNGIIHLKTDSKFLHGYVLGILEAKNISPIFSNHSIYKNNYAPDEVLKVKTFYEKKFLDKNSDISYLSFRLD